MTVRKIETGSWRVDVTVGSMLDGTRDRRVKHFKTKAEAEKFERSLLVKKDVGLVGGHITIDEFIETVFWEQKKNLRPNTKRGYERDIKLRILPALSGKYLEDINRYHIQQMISSCDTKKVATNARETLSSILNLACEMELIAKNPAGYHYQYPQKGIHDKDHYGVWLSNFSEHREFLERINTLDAAPMLERIFILGLCFGLRKGEIFGLNWENVDFNKRTIHITQTYVVGKGGATLCEPKTERSNRVIPITSYAYDRLSLWREDGALGAIVTTQQGKRMNPNSGHHMVYRFLGKHPELPRVTIHSLRHSFATACINAGVEVSKVSAWLGHREVSTTYNRYVKPLLRDLQSEVSVIDAAFSGQK